VQIYAIMAQLWLNICISIWQLPPCWMLWDINFAGEIWSGPSFSISASNLVLIGSKMTELWPFNWFHNGGRRHLGFLTYVNFDGKSGCRTQFSASASNSVQIYAIMVDLWPKEWFSIWRSPPSWILRDINFAGKTSCGTSFYVPVSNLVRIGSKMTELLPLNWFQNGGRRHLEFTSCDYFYSSRATFLT